MIAAIEAQKPIGSPVAIQALIVERDQKTYQSDKPVTGKNVTSLSSYILQVLESEPDHSFCPLEIATMLQVKPASVRQALKRLSSPGKGSGLVIKIDHGWYQYSAEKNGQLSKLISHSSRVGIENLVYVTKGARYEKCQADIAVEMVDNRNTLRTPKPGYPRFLSTGQEIRWENEPNGAERLSFISHGNPFSIDLILYLHDELTRQGFNGNEWERVSIEVNKDGMTMVLNRECITLQETRGVFLKAYNHGQQARFEVVDRTGTSLKDTLSLFMSVLDNGAGKTALREVKELSERLTRAEKVGQRALNVATRERDVRIQGKTHV